MKIEKEQFNDTEFFKAEDKYRTAKHFQRFVKNGFQRKDFNKRVYEHLHLHCGFIAHYNIDGFYQEYFNGSKSDLKRFAEHFLNFENSFEDVYNYTNIRMGNYQDINKVFADILNEYEIKKQVEE
ncbi:MAG TPA: hypothetical protein VJ895_00495 [Candidatus Nanoarchaeia archaeon]|nr:hypothetical protein [Candidatus Nanoarchaeia archaeon]